MKWVVGYIASIVLVNVAFLALPLVSVVGVMVPPASLLVGAVFILRDYAQRQIGHGVIVAMLVGAVLSYFLASPAVAFASAAAFLVSETLDWLVYTFTRRSFRERVVYSSLVGAPVDSAVFLALVGFFSWPAVALMSCAKLLALVAVVRPTKALD